MIFKKDFIIPNNKKILTNDNELKDINVKYSNYSNEKWVNLNFYKVKNNLYTENIIPLYIEEASISKKKN